jgi:hypothetical protein
MYIIANVTVLDSDEFDRLVKKYIPNSQYECVAYDEWSNNEDHLFNITPLSQQDLLEDSYYNTYRKPDMDDFIKTGIPKHVSACYILNYLINELKVLPNGCYLIRVDW